MEKFKYLFIIGCTVNIVHLCYASPEKRKRSSGWPMYHATKQAEYEAEHYQAYSSNTDLYTNWPELKINNEINVKTCKTYLQNLFTKKDFEKCTVTPSIKHIKLLYMKNISSSLGYLIREHLTLKSLLCHVDKPPASNHRKYFHFIRTSKTECVYLINRQQHHSLYFYISLRLCKHDTHHHLENTLSLEGAINKQKMPRKKPRDRDSFAEREEYERSHQLWVNQISVKADTWPELAEGNLRMFCAKLLRKLYPKTIITSDVIDPKYYLTNLSYTILRNGDGFEFPSLKVIVISCETRKNRNRGGHIFIRAPNHGSSNCVYMIRAATNRSNKYLRIIKRLCIQKLYVNEGQGVAMTNTGVNVCTNNENVSGPIITEGHSRDSVKPTPTEEEELNN